MKLILRKNNLEIDDNDEDVDGRKDWDDVSELSHIPNKNQSGDHYDVYPADAFERMDWRDLSVIQGASGTRGWLCKSNDCAITKRAPTLLVNNLQSHFL